MLEPQSRAAFADELRPPIGYELAQAVGTTFTLDLVSALTVPLSFAVGRFGKKDDDADVLSALRRTTDRIDVFAQTGQIRLGKSNDLTTLLEPMIHPVAPKRGGLFHPKVWLLEYQSGSDHQYRMLCASRNLTEDHSWDILLRLDGEPIDEPDEAVHQQNKPLVRFLRSLHRHTVNPMSSERSKRISSFASRIRRVRWDRLDGADPVFHYLDGQSTYDLNIRGTDGLIISPFVTDEQLESIRSGLRGKTTLLSLPDQLDRLQPSTLGGRLQPMILNEAANLTELNDEIGGEPVETGLSGLHAKALIIHNNHRSRVIVGSANATTHAYKSNVEMMVEFNLTQSQYGINSVIEALGDLVEKHPTAGGELVPDSESAQYRLEAYCRDLARSRFYIRCFDESPYGVRIWIDDSASTTLSRAEADNVTFRYRMMSPRLVESSAFPTTEESAIVHTSLQVTDISPFLEVTATDESNLEVRSVVLATIYDDIEDRRDIIIAQKLKDTDTLIRFLAQLLELEGFEGSQLISATTSSASASGFDLDHIAILEPFVQAVESKHEGLEQAKRIIDGIRRLDSKRESPVLDDSIEELWGNVWDAYLILKRTQES